MKILLTVFTGLLLFFGCNTTTKKTNDEAEMATNFETEEPTKKPISESTDFQFSKFKIMKGQLGPIKIGMTIKEAENQFDELTKKEDKAINYGIDGGGSAYVYYSGNEIIFGLIPNRDNDTVLRIIAKHENLRTTNGLSPNSSVKELLNKYPDLMVNRNLMMGWEHFQDRENGWGFVFKTNQKNRIGEYPDVDNPSKPKRLTTKTDWITMR